MNNSLCSKHHKYIQDSYIILKHKTTVYTTIHRFTLHNVKQDEKANFILRL